MLPTNQPYRKNRSQLALPDHLVRGPGMAEPVEDSAASLLFKNVFLLSLFLLIAFIITRAPQFAAAETTALTGAVAIGAEAGKTEAIRPDPITIGAIFAQTGIAAPQNEPMINMIRMTIADINSNGGVLGRPLKLVLKDNKSTPIGSAVAAKALVAENVSAVLGAYWSSHSLAMAPIFESAGIPMISPGSTNPEVTRNRRFIFRTCFLDSAQGSAMAKFACRTLKLKRAVIMANIDETYSTGLAGYFKQSFLQYGGTVLAELSYRGNALDFTENIRTSMGHKPELVYLPGYARDSGLIIRQARKLGCRAIFLGGDAWDQIDSYAGEQMNGCFHSASYHPDLPFAQSARMKKLYNQTFSQPLTNPSQPLAYDAVLLLARAIERAGTDHPRAIRDGLASITDFEGATGPISFQGSGDPVDKLIFIVEFSGMNRLLREAVLP